MFVLLSWSSDPEPEACQASVCPSSNPSSTCALLVPVTLFLTSEKTRHSSQCHKRQRESLLGMGLPWDTPCRDNAFDCCAPHPLSSETSAGAAGSLYSQCSVLPTQSLSAWLSEAVTGITPELTKWNSFQLVQFN